VKIKPRNFFHNKKLSIPIPKTQCYPPTMKLVKLKLENFRNYQGFAYDFTSSTGHSPDHPHLFEIHQKDHITILVGPNGLGKTNFLEAIYALSLGKSFRTSSKEDLILRDQDYFRCRAEFAENSNDQSDSNSDDDLETTELEVFYSERPARKRSFKKNGVPMRNSNYIGNLLTVLFHPEDLNILYLSPSLRRKYLNIVLSQTDRLYLEALSKYKKILRQRNALLHTIRDLRFKGQDTTLYLLELDTWDGEIVQYGSQIIEKRQQFTDFLNKKLTALYDEISDGGEELKVIYESKIPATTTTAPTAGSTSSPTTQETYLKILQERRTRDILKAETSAGPHRDDLSFHLDKIEITRSASRGEFRTILLSMKLAEIDYIKEKTGQTPILLLDDVFSELDQTRQKHLISAIQSCQTIITTTDSADLKELL
jgi:DNA replication and repair protein RecF